LISASAWVTTLECVTRVELVPERTADGTVVLRAVVRGPIERLRRLMRRLARLGYRR
jgi:hypothetical protein